MFCFTRVYATVGMKVRDCDTQGTGSYFRLQEKGGRYNVLPAHHQPQLLVDEHVEAAGVADDGVPNGTRIRMPDSTAACFHVLDDVSGATARTFAFGSSPTIQMSYPRRFQGAAESGVRSDR